MFHKGNETRLTQEYAFLAVGKLGECLRKPCLVVLSICSTSTIWLCEQQDAALPIVRRFVEHVRVCFDELRTQPLNRVVMAPHTILANAIHHATSVSRRSALNLPVAQPAELCFVPLIILDFLAAFPFNCWDHCRSHCQGIWLCGHRAQVRIGP